MQTVTPRVFGRERERERERGGGGGAEGGRRGKGANIKIDFSLAELAETVFG